MSVSKCASCGGKIDRICQVCPVCGTSFVCQRCGKILENNKSAFCSCCKEIRTQEQLEAARIIASETQNLCEELSKRMDS